jgi:hypothetical protein
MPKTYPVRLPSNEMKALGDFLNDYAKDYNDAEIGEWANKIYESMRFPLDADALRLVLEAAEYSQEGIRSGHHDGAGFDMKETDAAIAKIESLIR